MVVCSIRTPPCLGPHEAVSRWHDDAVLAGGVHSIIAADGAWLSAHRGSSQAFGGHEYKTERIRILTSKAQGNYQMQFKEALKTAGLVNPGRTTWCGVAADGTAVFTIWSHEVHQMDGRLFA